MVEGKLKVWQLIVGAIVTCVSNIVHEAIHANVGWRQKGYWIFIILKSF